MRWLTGRWLKLGWSGLLWMVLVSGCRPHVPSGSAEAGASRVEGAHAGGSMQRSSAGDMVGGSGLAVGSEAIATDAVAVTLGDRETFQKWLEERRGRVVLVDFWATWCPPCVQQFPHAVELCRQHRDAGLEVISVSMNEPGERASVEAFLTKREARFEHLLTRYGAGAEFVEAFELRGDIPFYRLYGRDGRLRYAFSSDPDGIENGEPIERIDQRIEELLAESSAGGGE